MAELIPCSRHKFGTGVPASACFKILKEERHSAYDKSVNRDERKQLDEEHLATGIEIKEAYHQERYGNAAMPEPLVSDKDVKQELEVVAKPAPAETYRASLTPRFR